MLFALPTMEKTACSVIFLRDYVTFFRYPEVMAHCDCKSLLIISKKKGFSELMN